MDVADKLGIELTRLVCLGSLVTVRTGYQYPGFASPILLDHSTHLDVEDYELEWETDEVERSQRHIRHLFTSLGVDPIQNMGKSKNSPLLRPPGHHHKWEVWITMNLTPEQELVLLLAEYRNPRKARIVELVSQKLDWSYVLGHVVYNRTAGLAYHVLSQCELQGASIHREFRLGLYTAYEFQLMRTKGYKSLVEEIATSLDASGLPYALLKGAILAFSTYPMGCRVSNDIDILVRPEHLTGVGQALKAAGFTQGYYDPAIRAIQPATRHEILSARMNGGQIIPYQKAVHVPGIDFVAVDVNFSLDWVASGTESKVAAFLEASVLYPLTDSPVMVRSLSREHFLAHLCAHRFKEAYVLTWVQSQRDLSLYKFVDIYGFLTESGQRINWDRFAKIAADNLIVRECYYALALTRTFFPVLNQDQEFVKSLEQLAPADTSYLDHVVEATNSKSRYQWTSDLITRFFDSKRYQTLVPLP